MGQWTVGTDAGGAGAVVLAGEPCGGCAAVHGEGVVDVGDVGTAEANPCKVAAGKQAVKQPAGASARASDA